VRSERSNTVTCVVNGVEHSLALDPRTTLLDALREHLELMGTKKGCDHGQCGSCTVIIDGRRVLSCLSLAVAMRGRSIVTIEGVADGETLHKMQQAFVDNDAYQCGYCTPGQICSAIAMLDEFSQGWPSVVTLERGLVVPVLDAEEIRERMSGNLCRCGAYANIVPAILEASE
jgi:xanthine dehydrogenase YagT iron-sulfur-binding subunit